MHEFLVVGELDDQRAVEDFLEIFGEFEGDRVSDVHAVAARPSSRVEVERLALFISVQNFGEVPM